MDLGPVYRDDRVDDAEHEALGEHVGHRHERAACIAHDRGKALHVHGLLLDGDPREVAGGRRTHRDVLRLD